jgi:predicted DNA-binding protein
MVKSEKKLKNLEDLLKKNDPALINRAIEMLREEEPFEGAIALLASCYDENEAPLIRRAIENFMNDIKDQSLRPEIIEEIKKDFKPETKTMLVSSCWQSRLDYSGFSYDLASAFLNNSYSVAVECFTVIEESIPMMDTKAKNKIVELIKVNQPDGDIKRSLADQLLSLLE